MNCGRYIQLLGATTLLTVTSCISDVDKPLPPVFNSVRHISVDLNQEMQTIDGFGASDAWRCQFVGKNWPEEKRKQIADWLFSQEVDDNGNPKGIGLSLWRFYIGAGSTEQGDDSGIADEWRRSECFQNVDGTYDWNKYQGQRWFLRAARDRGVERFLAFSLSAPVHMSKNGKGYSISGDKKMNIKEGMMSAYADYLVESVYNLERLENVKFNYLSPINEPQWDWGKGSQEGTSATNEEMTQFTKLLSDKLQTKGLATTIALGEAGAIEYLYKDKDDSRTDNQVEDFWNSSSPYSIAGLSNVENVITGHSYWSVWPADDAVAQRRMLNDQIKQYGNLKYWQTEYSILESPGASEIPGGNGNMRDLGMQTALFVARIIHNDLTLANASSWSWWTALTRADYKDGLVYLDDGNSTGSQTKGYCKEDGVAHDSKLMWMLGNWSRFVRPGMKRINVTTPNPDPVIACKDVMVSAFKDDIARKVVLVFVNVGTLNRKYNLENLNLENNALTPYITSETSNLSKVADMPTNNIVIPSKSIVTLVGQLQ